MGLVVGQILIFIHYKLWVHFQDLLISWYVYIKCVLDVFKISIIHII